MKEWFACWFGTPYYSILYGKHNEEEAALFLDKLIDFTGLKKGARCWDLNCGKGRHSVYLNKKGFDITGTDLSEENIAYAQQNEHSNLRFYKHDMRNLFRSCYYDAVFNLFTSFGYFRNPHDDVNVFLSVFHSLKPGGIFVLDYFNSVFIKKHMLGLEKKQVKGIDFEIRKKIESGFIIKEIKVHDKTEEYLYKEEVRLFSLADFEALAKKTGFSLRHCFGDYTLSPFDPDSSERLILIFAK